MATTLRVGLKERAYDILIGRQTTATAGVFVKTRCGAKRAICITDANVRQPHGDAVAQALAAEGLRADLLSVPAGEGSKSVAEAERLWNEFSRLRADRKTVVVAIGGGVVGDLAGFIAATFARGLAFIQVPTTLLAQVDSSVGGKVGINLPSAKNIVGAFWQPAGVLIDLDSLATLPKREYLSGLAEVVKYGVILDPQFFEYLESHVSHLLARDLAVLEHVVARSCALKATVVEQDEREETGIRAALNYGHTFCHAIETVTGYGHYLHGEAVAIGMVCASRLAELLGRIPSEITARQVRLLQSLGLPTEDLQLSVIDVLSAMQHDKKSDGGDMRFVLPCRLGRVEVVGNVPPELVRRAVRPL